MEQESSTATTPKKPDTPDVSPNTAPTLILQWLTYAFWGWCAFAVIWLSAAVFNYFLNHNTSLYYNPAEEIAYPVAAIVVLTLIAGVIDAFYSRREPAKKTGAAMVIMVVHAVIFALFAIGAAIVAVFALVNMLISAEKSAAVQVVLFSALVSLLFYVALIARTTLFGHVKFARLGSWIVLGITAVSLLITAIVGPVIYASTTKQDRRIEQALPDISGSISSYLNDKKQLPASLNDLLSSKIGYLSKEDKAVIEDNLIIYRPNVKPSTTAKVESSAKDQPEVMIYPPIKNSYTRYYYELCADFTAERTIDEYSSGYGKGGDSHATPNNSESNGYEPFLYNVSHPKGNHCFKLYAELYDPMVYADTTQN
ncbi:MAG: hypothetical protein ACM3MA_02375 [Acidobacteriota bacterium]